MEAAQGPLAPPQCLVLLCSALFPLQVLAPDLIAVALSTQPWGHRQPHGHGNSWHSSNLVSRAVQGRAAQGSRAGGCSFLPSSPSHLQMHSPTALTTFTTAHISASRNHMDCVKHSSEDEDGTRGQQGWMGRIQKHHRHHIQKRRKHRNPALLRPAWKMRSHEDWQPSCLHPQTTSEKPALN